MDDDVTAAVRAFKAATTTTRDDVGRRAIWRSLEARTQSKRSHAPLYLGAAAVAIAAALVLAFGGLRGDDAVRDGTSRAEDLAIDAADRDAPAGTAEIGSVVPAELDASVLPRSAPAATKTVAPIPAPTKIVPQVREVVAPAAVEPVPIATVRADALKREAALLLRARQAALANDRAAARVALDAHAQQFPRGELAPERWKLTIELACSAGDTAVAARAAAAFTTAYPDAPSAKALRNQPCDSLTNPTASGQSSAGAR